MTEPPFPHLRNAPITEALIDIRAHLDSNVTLADLEQLGSLVPNFSEKQARVSLEAKIQVKDGVPTIDPSTTPDGFNFKSSIDGLVMQARLNGFTVHKLKPYQDWPTLAHQAQQLWAQYVLVARPARVTRVALRYVNRIELPIGVDIKDYLLTGPEIAPGLPQDLQEFLLRAVVQDSGLTAVITEATPPQTSPDSYGIILDIDVFRAVDIDPSDSEIWQRFEELRSFKNSIFFRTVTSNTIRMYL